MARAPWTYEVPVAGASASALDEYAVEDRAGEVVGKVMALLERGSERYVAVERGTPPLRRDLRAVPWDEVERVDHDGLAVRLRMSARELEGALELDPDKGVEGAQAEAMRLAELPPELRPTSSPEDPGPVDRPSYLLAVGLGLAGVFSLLVVFLLATELDFTWHYALLAVPAALLLLSLVAAYRLLRHPYERLD